MKFAKEIEDDLVPEWRVKYLNYKQGKKKIKAIAKALKNVNRGGTPASNGRPLLQSRNTPDDVLPYTHYDFNQRSGSTATESGARPEQGSSDRRPNIRPEEPERRESMTMFAKSPPIMMPQDSQAQDYGMHDERTPLYMRNNTNNVDGIATTYGSFVGTPPERSPPNHLPSLELPDPALDLRRQHENGTFKKKDHRPKTQDDSHMDLASPDAYHVGQTHHPPKPFSSLPKHLFNKKHHSSGDKSDTKSSSKMKKLFSSQNISSPNVPHVQMQAFQELDAKQEEFFKFLDKELDKINSFYSSKEEEANHRLHVLRQQLHEMRDRRLQDIQKAKQGHEPRGEGILEEVLAETPFPDHPGKRLAEHLHPAIDGKFLRPVQNAFSAQSKIGKTSKARESLASPPGPKPKDKRHEGKSDYVRKREDHEHVPYRFAKRRLKLALQEFYRALELLKSYVLLNRTAFRKINKKYDKAVKARPTGLYMSEKVNRSYFVKSDVIDSHLVAVEDLYARYFERGNHKVAVNKLRSKLRSGDQSNVTFRNGLYVAAGACFGIAGLVNGNQILFGDNETRSLQTSYLLQIYAGYFLALLLFLLFVIDCRIWTKARINYVFVFEYDTRHVLDWRQLAELPCFFLFLNGFFLWLNFEFSEAHPMYLYWPVILIGITVLTIFNPIRTPYYHARTWWAYSNWRLLLAGLYPVEFRDFFLGDMYCSETYSLSQMEIFFCLYAHNWRDPPQCNSSHSMLLGFFTTLPAIWRALQCLRRYYDSRNWFPHLANFTKYLGNIVYYMTLSLYRLNVHDDLKHRYKITFIFFAAVNGLYCSFWDVFMDFSLGNPWSKNRFLRDNLGYHRKWVYYVAMVADVILRHQWICYAVFTEDLQHSASMSFFVALAEVFRRGMWSLFRVENEHCNNVTSFRASRDIPLPYSLPDSPEPGKAPESSHKKKHDRKPPTSTIPAGASTLERATTTGAEEDLERASTQDSTGTNLRQRKSAQSGAKAGMGTLQRVGTVIAAAHSQDFQKKRRPEVVGDSPADEAMMRGRSSANHEDHGEDSSDDDDTGDEDFDPYHEDEDPDPGLNVIAPSHVDNDPESERESENESIHDVNGHREQQIDMRGGTDSGRRGEEQSAAELSDVRAINERFRDQAHHPS